MNIPLCLICNKSPHDPKCPYMLKDEEITETLSDNEREMFQARAEEWITEPAKVQKYLNIAALVTLQKLVKDALRPGGKDPATTSLRAIVELTKKNADWMEGIKEDKSSDTDSKTRKRSL